MSNYCPECKVIGNLTGKAPHYLGCTILEKEAEAPILRAKKLIARMFSPGLVRYEGIEIMTELQAFIEKQDEEILRLTTLLKEAKK